MKSTRSRDLWWHAHNRYFNQLCEERAEPRVSVQAQIAQARAAFSADGNREGGHGADSIGIVYKAAFKPGVAEAQVALQR
ncbi:hypothetical protein [Gimesia algae]|uniref:Uncharacterized protein n=1 Tax=Gimesia algae TaxID=2527971 RepID=A0A517VA89_9PLAN|nr:hypothetical protein [Gimesia algae]QDT89915.1 hypothetical protein Pan161_15480 [Gimesia algae]